MMTTCTMTKRRLVDCEGEPFRSGERGLMSNVGDESFRKDEEIVERL